MAGRRACRLYRQRLRDARDERARLSRRGTGAVRRHSVYPADGPWRRGGRQPGDCFRGRRLPVETRGRRGRAVRASRQPHRERRHPAANAAKVRATGRELAGRHRPRHGGRRDSRRESGAVYPAGCRHRRHRRALTRRRLSGRGGRAPPRHWSERRRDWRDDAHRGQFRRSLLPQHLRSRGDCSGT